jgi:hypothetical protein
MAAESNTPVDIEIWIKKIINSCETLRHLINTERLIRLYLNRLKHEGLDYDKRRFIEDRFDKIYLDRMDKLQTSK